MTVILLRSRQTVIIFLLVLLWVCGVAVLVLAEDDSDDDAKGPWGGPFDPVADSHSVVVVLHEEDPRGGVAVRLTVLTSRLLRIERTTATATSSSSSGVRVAERNQSAVHYQFEDRPTLTVLNRKFLPVPNFTISSTNATDGPVFVLQTKHLKLTYKPYQNDENGAFTTDSLSVTGPMRSTTTHEYFKTNCKNENNPLKDRDCNYWTWHYGDVDGGNLLGTIRTLDELTVVDLNCSVQHNNMDDAHCEYGLVSRSGFAIVNDTSNWCLKNHQNNQNHALSHYWWDGPNQDREDFYILGYGHDYKSALKDFTRLSGRIPLLPRYALGVWFSRWYNYNPDDVLHQVSQYEQRSLPLDVFVLDMNWHTKNDWTGYSWDPRLYLDESQPPHNDASFLTILQSRGLALTLNLHDADGVGPWETQYEALCNALGLDPTKLEAVDFTIVNQTVMQAIDDVVLHPLQKNGVDFWWIDWQQGETGPGGSVGGKMNPTIWTAHVRSTQPTRLLEDRRAMVLARWGGLGAHRYPVHFSGDVAELSWETLAFQVYFSMTATNVLAIWSHDTHAPRDQPELYTRFVQWSVFSGITRAHERGWSAGDCIRSDYNRVCTVVEPWDVPTVYAEANFEALRLRAQLLPYLYTAAWRAHETGLQWIVPLYYEWPELEGAYETARFKTDNRSSALSLQYLFGSDDVWVAPIIKPADDIDGLSKAALWVPPGEWVAFCGGGGSRVFYGTKDGSTAIPTAWDLNEIPVVARSGAVIPIRSDVRPGHTVGLAMEPYKEIEWLVCLSRGAPMSGSGSLYEDDGRSLAHTRGIYAITFANYTIVPSQQEPDRSHVVLSVASTGQPGRDFAKIRAISFRLLNTVPPYTVSYYNNGTRIPWSRVGGKGTWSFDAKNGAVVIELPMSPIVMGETTTIVIETRTSGNVAEALDGMAFKIRRARAAKASLDEARITPGSQTGQADSAGALLRASSTGSSLEYLAGHSLPAFDTAVLGYNALFAAARQEVNQMVNRAQAADSATSTQQSRQQLANDEWTKLFAAPEIQYRINRALALLDSAS